MLARELKIKNLKTQREFIQKQIISRARMEDGCVFCNYVGYIYPEVIEYFEKEGFVITKIESELLTAINGGLPTNIITVGDFKLTEEELQEAEDYDLTEGEVLEDNASEFLAALLGRRGGLF